MKLAHLAMLALSATPSASSSHQPATNPHAIWDTHLHILDPLRFPFRPSRSYTPSPAPPSSLLATSLATNFLLVQASIENGTLGLLTHVRELQQACPERKFRAEIEYFTPAPGDEYSWSAAHLNVLHDAGVRCLRLRLPSTKGDADATAAEIQSMLSGRLGRIARSQGWAVSMQLPLQVWASLAPYLSSEEKLTIIAEHCASITVPLTSPSDVHAFSRVIELLRARKLFIKLGALHRRIKPGGTMEELLGHIRTMADAGPKQLLWGSDWPHVDTTPRGSVESPNLEVDEGEELELVRGCMPRGVAEDMLLDTPGEIFR